MPEEEMSTSAEADFTAWRNKWDVLGRFDGPQLRDPERRISEILSLWQIEPPGPWRRSAKDLPKRLLKDGHYARGNGNSKRPGEHRIEFELLERDFVSVTYNGRHLLDGVNAFPLVKSTVGRRNDNVEADLVILVGPTDAASILVLDVKKTDGNAWSALVQNLRQLRLFLSNPVCISVFADRKSDATIAETIGGVIAPGEFYTSKRKKKDSVPHACKLIDAMREAHNVFAELFVWDARFQTAISTFKV
jgi:hypothetical protein